MFSHHLVQNQNEKEFHQMMTLVSHVWIQIGIFKYLREQPIFYIFNLISVIYINFQSFHKYTHQ